MKFHITFLPLDGGGQVGVKSRATPGGDAAMTLTRSPNMISASASA
ncbi:MAG: hypothetical protein HY579_01165 [Nitrospinae bacterium]|nr:hypothetical protein [Nitrospinota bacterium]